MQFKRHALKRGVTWEIVRWVYDPADGRSKPQTIGRVKDFFSSVPPPLMKKCSESERKEIADWWQTLKAGEEIARLRVEPQSFAVAADRLIDAVSRGLVDADGAKLVGEKIQQLLDALNKGGNHERQDETTDARVGG